MMKKILLAIDGSDQSFKALEMTGELANRFDSEVDICHALLRGTASTTLQKIADRLGCGREIGNELASITEPVVPTAGHAYAMTTTMVIPDSILIKLAQYLVDFAKTRLTEFNVNVSSATISDSDPAGVILELAGSGNADLIVIGSRGLGDLKSLVLGSVSHKILQSADCPCLLVKQSDN